MYIYYLLLSMASLPFYNCISNCRTQEQHAEQHVQQSSEQHIQQHRRYDRSLHYSTELAHLEEDVRIARALARQQIDKLSIQRMVILLDSVI